MTNIKPLQLSFRDCANLYRAEISRRDIKPRAAAYRNETVSAILKLVPGNKTLRVSTIDFGFVFDWSERARIKYKSPSRFNGMLQSFRGILDCAVRSGALNKNPMRDERFAPIKTKRSRESNSLVYSRDDLTRLFNELKLRSVHAHFFCRFLYHFTLRVETARNLTPSMADKTQVCFKIPGDFVKGERSPKLICPPILPEMADLLGELDAFYGAGREKLLPVANCRGTLRRACLKLGLPVISFHRFRHFFATHALESGVDYRVLAGWLNHKDGGALLLKRYAHITDSISRNQASGLRIFEDKKPPTGHDNLPAE